MLDTREDLESIVAALSARKGKAALVYSVRVIYPNIFYNRKRAKCHTC